MQRLIFNMKLTLIKYTKKARLSSLAYQPSTTNRFYNPKNCETIVMNYLFCNFLRNKENNTREVWM